MYNQIGLKWLTTRVFGYDPNSFDFLLVRVKEQEKEDSSWEGLIRSFREIINQQSILTNFILKRQNNDLKARLGKVERESKDHIKNVCFAVESKIDAHERKIIKSINDVMKKLQKPKPNKVEESKRRLNDEHDQN